MDGGGMEVWVVRLLGGWGGLGLGWLGAYEFYRVGVDRTVRACDIYSDEGCPNKHRT